MIKTASVGGVVKHKGKILVVSQHGTSWSLPKGHIEENETCTDTIKRELFEESGLTEFEIIKKLGIYQRHKIARDGSEDKSELKTITMYFILTNQEKLNPQDPENPEARWVNKEEVAKLLTHQKDKEFFLSILSEI